MAQSSPDSAELAKRFIDASLKGRSRRPTKAAYARALRLAREAMEDLSQVASRMRG